MRFILVLFLFHGLVGMEGCLNLTNKEYDFETPSQARIAARESAEKSLGFWRTVADHQGWDLSEPDEQGVDYSTIMDEALCAPPAYSLRPRSLIVSVPKDSGDDACSVAKTKPSKKAKVIERSLAIKPSGDITKTKTQNKPGTCELCYAFAKSNLWSHMVCKHNVKTDYFCSHPNCLIEGDPRYFPSPAGLNRHNVHNHGVESDIKCQHCDKCFSAQSDLDHHQKNSYCLEEQPRRRKISP